MNNRRMFYLLIVILLLLVGSGQWVLADVAPPQYPPAGPIENGGFDTDVQMVSEEVLLVISEAEAPVSDRMSIASDYIQGHVEATFWMQNQGDEAESFEVWFPLGVEDGFSSVTTVDNFAASVDGDPAQITQQELPGEWDNLVPWATWPVTFPPGETVVITVTYDLRPTGYMPYGEFIYILETGAGWWGEIGEGTVTIRLPYEVNDYNAPIYSTSSTMDNVEIDGTDLIWHFTELEPVGEDNIHVNVMAPSHWEAILTAEEAVAENPESAEAYLSLANAQVAGLDFKYGLVCCEPLANAAAESYQQAWVLNQNDVNIQLDYLEFLLRLWYLDDVETYAEDIPPLIASALALAPEDEHLLELIQQVADNLWEADQYDIGSEIYEDAQAELYSILAEAVEQNPDNERLLELYHSFNTSVG